MKTGHILMMLSVIIAAPHLPTWYAIVSAVWFFCWGAYHIGKGE
jgi:hypothetical protein